MRAHSRILLAATTLIAVGVPLAPPSAAAPPTCQGKKATIVGTSGDDVIEGTKKADVIVALAGDDVVRGKGGDDWICGGNDADRLFGGPGADRLYGGFDRRGDDPAGTFLIGDVLDGGDGDDVLVGVHDDRKVDSHRRPDTVSYAEAPSGVVVDLSAKEGVATGQGTDTIRYGPHVGVEGSPHADTITGSSGRDRLQGLAGDDTLTGGSGNDWLFGEKPSGTEGDDTLHGGTGRDLLGSYAGRDEVHGGGGNDFVEAYSDAPTRVFGDTGNDLVHQNLTSASGAGSHGGGGRDVLALYGELLEGAEPRTEVTIDLRDGTTSVALDPPATGTIGGFEDHRLVGDLRWRFHGTAVRDLVWAASGGPIRIWTYGGDDRIFGSDHADLINGGAGTDSAEPGRGDDTCVSIERGC